MTGFDVSAGSPAEVAVEALAVPCFAGPTAAADLTGVTAALGTDLLDRLRRRGFAGRPGELVAVDSLGRIPADEVVFVGLGPADLAPVDAVRRFAMQLGARQRGRLAALLPSVQDVRAAAVAFAEGVLLGGYRFDRYKPSGERPALEQVSILAEPARHAGIASGISRGEVYARVTNWARDMVNTPAGDATPADLVDEAGRMAAEHGIGCTVWGREELARGGFGGVLGVGQGSVHEPALVELTYLGAGNGPRIGLAGKGITFDSGGLSLKRTAEMEWMKSDMAGAAAMMAVVRGAAELRLPVNLHAVLPFAENLPSGSALRPGDVVRHRGGKTSEIADTDCEGRLVLADALAYLAEHQPVAIVDAATLTDAAGLGDALWAVMGNDAGLAGELLAAGEAAGDPGWQLPLPAAYRRYLDSTVAQIRNAPTDVPDTTITAARYLEDFVADTPWLHIDNGSTAYLERPGELWPKGATGSPARAVLRWLEARAAPAPTV